MTVRFNRRALLRGGVAAALGSRVILDRTLEAMAAVVSPCAGLTDIEHVVFVIQENRAFDHYFGRYRGVRGFDDRSVKVAANDDGTAVFHQVNPGHSPDPFLPYHINTDRSAGPTGECIHDIGHQWVSQHESWDHGTLGG